MLGAPGWSIRGRPHNTDLGQEHKLEYLGTWVTCKEQSRSERGGVIDVCKLKILCNKFLPLKARKEFLHVTWNQC